MTIREVPEDGKANKSIVRKFSEFFGNCEIVRGNSSRKKTVMVENLKIEDVDQVLRNIMML